MNKSEYCQYGKEVIQTELNAINTILNKLDGQFAEACEVLLHCMGRIIVVGIGKSGHIGHKIAATLASTGSPAFFVHPAEAIHGDLGMITKQDVVLAISYSGKTKEILTLIPVFKRLGIPLITLTGDKNSMLAQQADVNLDISVQKEACPFNLAPTASTTTTLVIGDAIAITLLKAKGFSKEDFAFSHPGGTLGRKLLLRINEIMLTGDDIPQVLEDVPMRTALIEMSRKSLGMTAVISSDQNVVGIFTDGDLRRVLDNNIDVHHTSIKDVMTKPCTTVKSNLLAAEAVKMMETKRFNALLVVDDQNKLIGALNLHTLLRAGVV